MFDLANQQPMPFLRKLRPGTMPPSINPLGQPPIDPATYGGNGPRVPSPNGGMPPKLDTSMPLPMQFPRIPYAPFDQMQVQNKRKFGDFGMSPFMS